MSTPEPAPAASSASKPYTIVGNAVRVNRPYGPNGDITAGWEVSADWKGSGERIIVFVPDGEDLAATADALIRQQGAQLDALHAL